MTKCGVIWHGHLLQTLKKLFKLWSRSFESFRTAINHDKLIPILTDHPTAQKSAIIWFIAQNVIVSLWNIRSMAATRIMKSPIGENPKNEFRIEMREIADGVTAPRVMLGEKWKSACRRLTRN